MDSGQITAATQIVDLYHAREHLHELAGILEFMLGDQREDWLAARLDDLDHGDIDGICAAARAYPLVGSKKTNLDKALGYFENNAPRMRYKWFRSRGLFVGSGAVEAGCKAVIGQRLKLSGMRWTVAGADAIILRCREASSQWETICNTPHNQTGAASPARTRKRSWSPTKLAHTRGPRGGAGMSVLPLNVVRWASV